MGTSWRSCTTGEITSGEKRAAGSILLVWVDARGQLAHPPRSRLDVAGQAIGAAAVTSAVLALVLAAVGMVISRLLDRYRLARWAEDWSGVEPQDRQTLNASSGDGVSAGHR